MKLILEERARSKTTFQNYYNQTTSLNERKKIRKKEFKKRSTSNSRTSSRQAPRPIYQNQTIKINPNAKLKLNPNTIKGSSSQNNSRIEVEYCTTIPRRFSQNPKFGERSYLSRKTSNTLNSETNYLKVLKEF